MIVTIIGWYGTETMGDRAILDGIFSVLSEIDDSCIVKIGSLYPFYTKRTFYEERDVFRNTAPQLSYSIFDVKDKQKVEENIGYSDLLLIGGGPLMDLEELYILKFCFLCAKKRGIPALVVGCGVGPLKKGDYIRVVEDIFSMATKIALRDNLSIQFAKELYGDKFELSNLGDPAVISIENYKKNHKKRKGDYIAINFREYPYTEYGTEKSLTINDCRNLLSVLQEKYKKIMLIPMHTFAIGNDDRLFLSRIIMYQKYEQVNVMHKPMNLFELYNIYQNAIGCVGMRYHSVVMQTILNGNNIILDYTDSNIGKIIGFVQRIEGYEFYRDRTISLQEGMDLNIVKKLYSQKEFDYKYSDMKKTYTEFIKKSLR